MDRRRFLAALAAGVLAAPSGVGADKRLRRVGWLDLGTAADTRRSREVLPSRMRELGWVEGKDIAYDWLYAEARPERLSPLVAELLRRKVDVIVTRGTTAIRAAQSATTTVPIVMAGGGDPVGAGLVKSLARPGGNVTGVSLLGQELMEKHVGLVKQLLPALRTLALIRAAANPANSFFAQHMDAAAQKLRVQLVILDIRGPDDLEAAFGRITADAAFMLLDPMFFAHPHRIAKLAIQRRLPLISADRTFAEAGFLMSYGTAGGEVLRLTAVFVDKILRGAKPADLPVEQPSRLELVVNLATAKTLGLNIPREILLQADEVIN